MKARILVGMLVFVLSGASFADDPAIVRIRNEYQSIQTALTSLKLEEKELEGYSTDSGDVKAYRDGKGNIRLVKVKLYFESGNLLEEFYYENGILIFAFYQWHQFNVPYNITPELAKEIGFEDSFNPKKTKIKENRYYFDKAKMIRWLNESNKEVEKNSKEFKETEKEVTDMSHEMLSQFKR